MDKKKEFEALPETRFYPNDKEIRFDLDSLEESNFKRMIKYLDDIFMYPTEFIISTVLTALSGAVGKYVYWQLSESFRLYLNIWCVIVAPSSILNKSSVIKRCLHDVLRIDETFRHDYNKQKENYENEIKGKNNTEIAGITKPQRNYLMLPSDFTMESLSDILAKAKRGLMFHSEFGAWLAQLGRTYNQDAKMTLSDLFDVPPHKDITRKSGNTFIERPYFSMIGASVSEWIRSNSNHDDLRTGFFARILFSIRNTNDKKFIGRFHLGEHTYSSKYYYDTRGVYDFLTNMNEEKTLTATEKAVEIYDKYEIESRLNLMKKMDNNDEVAFKARLQDYVLKFAGLMALAEMRFEVNEIDMRNAIRLAAYYSLNIEKLIADELVTKTDFVLKEEKFLKTIKDAGSISRVDLMLKKYATDKKEFDRIIENLIEKDQIEICRDSKIKGRKAQFYRYKQT